MPFICILIRFICVLIRVSRVYVFFANILFVSQHPSTCHIHIFRWEAAPGGAGTRFHYRGKCQNEEHNGAAQHFDAATAAAAMGGLYDILQTNKVGCRTAHGNYAAPDGSC